MEKKATRKGFRGRKLS